MQVKSDILVREQHAKSLGGDVVVYARAADPEETLIVRRLQCALFNAFGLKGRESMELLFRGIIKLLAENSTVLQGLRYGVGEKLTKFIDVLDEIDDVQTSEDGVRLGEDVLINLQSSNKYPQIGRLSRKDNGEVFGVHLFWSQVEKLLKYMNVRFKFDESLDTTSRVKCDNDNFF